MNYINNPDLGDPDGNAMVPHFNDDHVVMGLQAATHWDALGHVSYAGSLYNGVPANTVTALGGSTVLGIENVRTLSAAACSSMSLRCEESTNSPAATRSRVTNSTRRLRGRASRCDPATSC